jgi:uncharacterized protein (TIGR02448 family)
MNVRVFAAATLLSLASTAHATSFVVTTDAVVGALAASVEATSDASSSLRDSKVILAARDDAASFVATAGELRGARLEAALRHLRSTVPSVATASDLQLAQAIVSL